MALTLDDGPSAAHTPQLLDMLAARRAPVTFFLVGKQVAAHPQLAQRALREGHQIYNHTFGHADLTTLNDGGVREQIAQTELAFARSGIPTTPRLVRPPYGAMNSRVRHVLAGLGYRRVTWTVDPQDWRGAATPDSLSNAVFSNLHRGANVLLHDTDATGNTLRALPAIIDGVRARGYCLGIVDGAGKVAAAPQLARPVAIAGDWDGDGRDTPGWYSDGRFYLQETSAVDPSVPAKVIQLGRRGDLPVAGDFDRDGRDDLAVFEGGRWSWRSARSSPIATFWYGAPDSVPVVGDWDGDGRDGIGVREGTQWLLRETASAGIADRTFAFGPLRGTPFAGDFDGDGRDAVGVMHAGSWALRPSLSTGPPEQQVIYGSARDAAVVGDWDGDVAGTDTPGLVTRAAWTLTNRVRIAAVALPAVAGPVAPAPIAGGPP